MTQPVLTGDHSFIVSDLHLAEGNLDRGRTLGTENFFSDAIFADVLRHLHSEHRDQTGKPLCFIINGDFVDFIRITQIPVTAAQFETWQEEVRKVSPQFSLPHSCISEREKKYGLKTNNYKCIWKLMCSINGHPELFEALARWVSAGNQLIINVGNHDPEWYWTWVQTYLKIRLWEIADQNLKSRSEFEESILFSKEAFPIYDKVWIDHGHNYEKQTAIDPDYEYDKVAPKKKLFWKNKSQQPKEEHEKELFIPFGSFFNRYLINKVELDFPHVDNLTAKGSMLRALIDENFYKVFRIIINFGGYALLVVQKNFQLSFFRVLSWLFFVVVPISLFVFIYLKPPTEFFETSRQWNGILKSIVNGILNFLLPILSRVAFKQILVWLKLYDPPLSDSAFKDLEKGGKLSHFDYIVLGHNHHPQHLVRNGKEYLNSGTWTSKYLQKYERIENGVTYNLVWIQKTAQKKINASLMKWDSDKGAIVPYHSFVSDLK